MKPLLWLFLRLAPRVGFTFVSVYAPGEDVLAVHFALDEAAFNASIKELKTDG